MFHNPKIPMNGMLLVTIASLLIPTAYSAFFSCFGYDSSPESPDSCDYPKRETRTVYNRYACNLICLSPCGLQEACGYHRQKLGDKCEDKKVYRPIFKTVFHKSFSECLEVFRNLIRRVDKRTNKLLDPDSLPEDERVKEAEIYTNNPRLKSLNKRTFRSLLKPKSKNGKSHFIALDKSDSELTAILHSEYKNAVRKKYRSDPPVIKKGLESLKDAKDDIVEAVKKMKEGDTLFVYV